MPWFEYSQNNSGGSFVHDPQRGIGCRVWVEAADAEEADYKAQRIGLYFDGVHNGPDCHCCGDRWSAKSEYNWSSKGQEEPPTIEDMAGGRGIGSYAHHEDGQISTVVAVVNN